MYSADLIRVAVVEDHDIVRATLIRTLRLFDDLQVIGEASNGVDAVRLCAKLQPDILLLDLKLPVMDGIQAAQTISQHYPDTKIIVLTSAFEDELIDRALRAGATTYLLKNVSINTLLSVIRQVYASIAREHVDAG